MSNQLQVSQPHRNELAKAEVTPAQMEVAKRTLAKDATPEEFELWMYDCQRQGVHPLDRMLHFTKRGGKYTPVAGIDLLRSRADETGEYIGNTDATFVAGKEFPVSATATIRRLIHGNVCEFTATARWAEYYPGDASGHMWRKMPHVMLAKCAEALALRKAFPRTLHGVYISEEMDQAGPSPARTQPAVRAVQSEKAPPTVKQPARKAAPKVVDVIAAPYDDETGEVLEDLSADGVEIPDDDLDGVNEPSGEDLAKWLTVQGVIKTVTDKPAKSGGKRYGVLIDGTWYGSFNESLGAYAQRLKGATVILWYENSGEFKNFMWVREA